MVLAYLVFDVADARGLDGELGEFAVASGSMIAQPAAVTNVSTCSCVERS